MATFAAMDVGWGVSDGESINAEQTRWSTLSSLMLAGGSVPLGNQTGILLTGGNPLQVTQKSTPGKGVTVKAGRISVPANSSAVAPLAAMLTANVDLDVADGHATNPRIDLVIVRVSSPGTSSAQAQVEILAGTPGAVPSRPTLPAGTDHCVSIATLNIPALNATVINSQISVVQSDTWTTATSDARYMAAPGGSVQQAGLVAMSGTRRAAWAALYAPGTPWWDPTAKVSGVTNGSDIVPLTTRKLYEVVDAATVQTSSTSPVVIANSGTLTVFGGTRKIRITATGKFNCNGSADTRWMAARAFLTGAGTIVSVDTQVHGRVWGAGAAPTVVSQQTFTLSRVYEAGAGTFSVQFSLLRVEAGGTGTGETIQCVAGGLLIEDIGPA